MSTTPWLRLDPETVVHCLSVEDGDQPGTPLPDDQQARILDPLRAMLRCGEVVAIARLRDGEEEIFLGSAEEAAERIRLGLH
ncbi:hypothetical protein [Paracraurococcus lichenis]|uniref:Uncharacterized protein n=1 Tax=Paracraurococcus lichenis TaxID=3064888 RepID=A0ABT9E6U4_9PROT|nr:hypothetical protein [Paracraurococcus sp. LOR1-02]MDO9711770.1 hypothetical protein [Paracraurococcus sp. LOR1-02]